jgi:hypothetical protein
MVKLRVQFSNATEEFLFETLTTESVDKISTEVSKIHNRRLQVRRLCGAAKDLSLYGPMRPENDRG